MRSKLEIQKSSMKYANTNNEIISKRIKMVLIRQFLEDSKNLLEKDLSR
ncbi:MAG: hypothetical protein WC867_08175 [Candidatus Pacearchaeota archaeon]|jgi:hypothetical protein